VVYAEDASTHGHFRSQGMLHVASAKEQESKPSGEMSRRRTVDTRPLGDLYTRQLEREDNHQKRFNLNNLPPYHLSFESLKSKHLLTFLRNAYTSKSTLRMIEAV
jgi:hypothetical protein